MMGVESTHRSHDGPLGWGGKLLFYGLGVVLLWAALSQFRAALGSRYSDRADAAMTFWTTPAMKRNPSQAEIDTLHRLLGRAQSLSPDNPTDHERLGQLYLWALATQSPDDERRRTLHDLGLAEVRRFVAMEPGWALAWAELLVWKAEFEEVDQEFRVALERATTLGQWHKKVHTAVLQATLPLWDELAQADRELVLDTAVRGLRQNSRFTLPILKEFEFLNAACRRLEADDALMQTDCKDVVAP